MSINNKPNIPIRKNNADSNDAIVYHGGSGSSPDDLNFSVFLENFRQKEPEKMIKGDIVNNQKSIKWIPNDAVKNCQKCNGEFGIWVRRHHCRACGKIFCYKCWGKK